MRKASLVFVIIFLTLSTISFSQNMDSKGQDSATEEVINAPVQEKVQVVEQPSTADNQVAESQPEMADALRKDGKIYVVVLVLATIFAGIIAFLVRLDRKISKLEQSK